MSAPTSSDSPSVSTMPEGVTDSNYKPLPGRLGNLTKEQQQTLDQLKQELKDEGAFVEERMDDAMLLKSAVSFGRALPVLTSCGFRFLRARKFDLTKAKAMLLAAEQWRKDFGVEDLVEFVIQFLHRMCRR